MLIAEAIANGLAAYGRVELAEVGEAPEPDETLDLIVVGGPTHAFGMSRRSTRENAASQTESNLVSPGIGIREWLARLPAAPSSIAGATFDTRIDKPRLPGSAAPKIHRALRKLGYDLLVAPESFYVDASLGPLVPGEPERARRWGEKLGARVQATTLLVTDVDR